MLAETLIRIFNHEPHSPYSGAVRQAFIMEQAHHSFGLPVGDVILKVSPEGSIINNP